MMKALLSKLIPTIYPEAQPVLGKTGIYDRIASALADGIQPYVDQQDAALQSQISSLEARVSALEAALSSGAGTAGGFR